MSKREDTTQVSPRAEQGPLAQVIATRGGTASPEAWLVIARREALIYTLCRVESGSARRGGAFDHPARAGAGVGDGVRAAERDPDPHRSGAGYELGSDRGSPNHGSTLLSKRVM